MRYKDDPFASKTCKHGALCEECGNREKRVKGSGDHRWTSWHDTRPGHGRTCLDCGCIDDGYQQPCKDALVKHLNNPSKFLAPGRGIAILKKGPML